MEEKGGLRTALLLLALLLGACLLAYPTVSDYWNSFHSSRAISVYAEEVATMDTAVYEGILADARAYNESLNSRTNAFVLDDWQRAAYKSTLNINKSGSVMGYLEIPSIGVSLPIYHGTSNQVLQSGIGHIDWSYLPVGGLGTHAVLSGHRGLPSAKLLTDLDKVIVGDLFMIRVLDEVFTYEVDRILIVEPNDTSSLVAEAGKDLVTLVTCTPYGINTHRMLVTGHRVDNTVEAQAIRITADAMPIEPMVVAPFIAIPVLFALLLGVLLKDRSRTSDREAARREYLKELQEGGL